MTAAAPQITVASRFDGQVAELTISAPPANIVTARLLAELASAVERAAAKPECKLLVLTGQGSHFSYGASVEEHLPEQVGAMLPGFHRAVGTLLASPVPTLARVTGLCLGGGFELAMACSLVFADEGAKLGVPEIQLGVFPPVAAALLPELIGANRAASLILSGDKVPAAQLRDWGLVTHVSAAGALDRDIAAFIEKQILPKSSSSLRIAHRAARRSVVEAYRTRIGDLEKLYLDELMSTKDGVEGIRAFVEKRSPKWVHA